MNFKKTRNEKFFIQYYRRVVCLLFFFTVEEKSDLGAMSNIRCDYTRRSCTTCKLVEHLKRLAPWTVYKTSTWHLCNPTVLVFENELSKLQTNRKQRTVTKHKELSENMNTANIYSIDWPWNGSYNFAEITQISPTVAIVTWTVT